MKSKYMEKERLKFCIERFDHYYDSTNNKGAVMLALGTFILGGLIAIYPHLKENIDHPLLLSIFMLIPIILCTIALIVVAFATLPYMKTTDTNSLHFYGSIAKKNEKEFCKASDKLKQEEELIDLRKQVYQLAKGLNTKYKKLRIAGILFIAMLLSLLPITTLIITSLK